MAKSLKHLLAEPDDFELCNGLFSRIVDYHGDDIDASAITEGERVVLLVWHVSGIIGNGGFRYLFEGNLKGDPYFALTAEAFQATGCKEAAEAVRKTLAIFPDSRPPTDIDERLRYYLKRIRGWPTDLDQQFFRAQDDLKKCLADYIRSHAEAFAHLDTPRIRRMKKDSKPAKAAARRKKAGPTGRPPALGAGRLRGPMRPAGLPPVGPALARDSFDAIRGCPRRHRSRGTVRRGGPSGRGPQGCRHVCGDDGRCRAHGRSRGRGG